MTWGVPRRPKISNKLGIPNPSEGSDGDIQVRQTNLGAKLFGKIGGRWNSTFLSNEDRKRKRNVRKRRRRSTLALRILENS